jgi:hypothetical protein
MQGRFQSITSESVLLVHLGPTCAKMLEVDAAHNKTAAGDHLRSVVTPTIVEIESQSEHESVLIVGMMQGERRLPDRRLAPHPGPILSQDGLSSEWPP